MIIEADSDETLSDSFIDDFLGMLYEIIEFPEQQPTNLLESYNNMKTLKSKFDQIVGNFTFLKDILEQKISIKDLNSLLEIETDQARKEEFKAMIKRLGTPCLSF